MVINIFQALKRYRILSQVHVPLELVLADNVGYGGGSLHTRSRNLVRKTAHENANRRVRLSRCYFQLEWLIGIAIQQLVHGLLCRP